MLEMHCVADAKVRDMKREAAERTLWGWLRKAR